MNYSPRNSCAALSTTQKIIRYSHTLCMKENFSQIDVVFGVNVVNAVERRYRA